MKKIIFSIVVIFTVAIGLSYAYADEFKMPFNPKNLVDHWVDVVFVPTEGGGVDVRVEQISLFHYNNTIEMPDQFVVQYVDNQGGITSTKILDIRQAYEDIIFPTIEPEPEESKVTPEIQARIDEKIAEREKVVEEALRCVLGIEGSSIFTEYRELLVLEKMIYFKSLPVAYQEKQIILWTEECRVWNESYLGNFRQYQDIFKDQQRNPAYSKVLDDSDSLATDPLTEQDFADEIEDAENFMCSVEGKQRGLCIKEFEGVNRGGYTEGAECAIRPGTLTETMCPLKDYNALISSAISAEENYTEIEKLVCEKYLNQYQALVDRIKAGDGTAKLPHWLSHCEVTQDE